jgi:hypothetical protein
MFADCSDHFSLKKRMVSLAELGKASQTEKGRFLAMAAAKRLNLSTI